jgi:putative Mg2+ transporter-C (MgtC) family protein
MDDLVDWPEPFYAALTALRFRLVRSNAAAIRSTTSRRRRLTVTAPRFCSPSVHLVPSSFTIKRMAMATIPAAHLLAAGSLNSEGWRQTGELSLAVLLSALIGLEREIRQKSAGLRTHTLVGVGAALFMLISKYGFTDVLQPGRVILDPSRVAAQIVTGVGFLGAGLIFVKRDSVRGLTTAAAVWVTAAIGAAAGAGLPVLAAFTTALYFVVAIAFPQITRRLPRSSTAISVLRIRYPDGRGILRHLLPVATSRGFAIDEVSTESLGYRESGASQPAGDSPQRPMVEVTLHVHGRASVNELAAALSELDEVDAVAAGDINVAEE